MKGPTLYPRGGGFQDSPLSTLLATTTSFNIIGMQEHFEKKLFKEWRRWCFPERTLSEAYLSFLREDDLVRRQKIMMPHENKAAFL
jgi:hypothetical protein